MDEITFAIEPGGEMAGQLQVPGDKSISHRALLLGALATGVTRVSGFLQSADCLATAAALQQLGVNCEIEGDCAVVHGVGAQGFSQPLAPLDLGNSGTAMRLLAGVLAAQTFTTTLTGDVSLRQRPMLRIAEPLRLMGAEIHTGSDGTPPLTIHAAGHLNAIDYTLPVASAQIKSCLLLAGLAAVGSTCVTEPGRSRDHTELMLKQFGCELSTHDTSVCVQGGSALHGCEIQVPGDISSATFFMVAAAIQPDQKITINGVGINPTRTGIIDCLRMMGARIEITNERQFGFEPVGDITVTGAPLRAIEVPPMLVLRTIDEFPALCVAAACAHGTTRITGAAELRVKESDRIAGVAAGLAVLGINCQVLPDGILIEGGRIGGGALSSRGDHRLAMAFAIAGLKAQAPIRISECRNVATSFPNFVAQAAQLGLPLVASTVSL